MSSARQSAFAKRRKLNNASGTTTPVSTSEAPSVTEVAVQQRPLSITRSRRTVISSRSSTATASVQAVDSDADETNGNSFEPLASTGKVKFSEIREIDHIDETCIKVRLSQHQSCVIRGIAKLWVRQGTVAVNGAALHASTALYNIFSIDPENYVVLEVVSKIAEFQLESVNPSRADLSMLHVPGKIARQYSDKIPTFDILPAVAAHEDLAARNRLYNQMSKALTRQRHKSAPTLVIAGHCSRNIDPTLCTINQFLSESAERPVKLLDLDYSMPIFGLPGTISLRMLTNPIFGPAYSCPQPSSADDLSTYYMGSPPDAEHFEDIHAFVTKILRTSATKDCRATIIRLGAWIANLTAGQLSRLEAVLKADLIFCVGVSPNSTVSKTCHHLVSDTEADMHFVDMDTATRVYSKQYLHLSVQSQFYFAQEAADTPLWYSGTLPKSLSRTVSFSNTSGTQLPYIIVAGGRFREVDIEDVLEGAFVMVLACQAEQITVCAPTQVSEGTGGFHLVDDSVAIGCCCLGIAYIQHIDTIGGNMTLNTPIPATVVEFWQQRNYEIAILIEKPTTTGPFDRALLLR